jgi:cytochrome c oxidase subunit 2
MFVPDSPLAQPISTLFIVILAIGTVILLLVAALVLYATVRYRARAGDVEEPRQAYGNLRLEIGWTVAPFLLVFALLIFSIIVMAQSDPVVSGDPPQPDVTIIAHQWWWEFRYPKSGVITANELHIPTGSRLYVQVESVDVIHDFWVPKLVRKIDAVPGHPNHLWLEASQPGQFLGTCAEYCGTQHAWMRILAIVQSPADFEAWQQSQLQTPSIPPNTETANGAQLFQQLPCINCHVITNAGPNLTHLGSRQTIGTGILTNTPENLAKWLADTQAVKPGVYMPNMNLTPDQINALVAYLEASK